MDNSFGPRNNTMIAIEQGLVTQNATHDIALCESRMDASTGMDLYPTAYLTKDIFKCLEGEPAMYRKIPYERFELDTNDYAEPMADGSMMKRDDNLPLIHTALNGWKVDDSTFSHLKQAQFAALDEETQTLLLRSLIGFAGIVKASAALAQGITERRDLALAVGGQFPFTVFSREIIPFRSDIIWDLCEPGRERSAAPMGDYSRMVENLSPFINRKRTIIYKPLVPELLFGPHSIQRQMKDTDIWKPNATVPDVQAALARKTEFAQQTGVWGQREAANMLLHLLLEVSMVTAQHFSQAAAAEMQESNAAGENGAATRARVERLLGAAAARGRVALANELKDLFTNGKGVDQLVQTLKAIYMANREVTSRIVGTAAQTLKPGTKGAIWLNMSYTN